MDELLEAIRWLPRRRREKAKSSGEKKRGGTKKRGLCLRENCLLITKEGHGANVQNEAWAYCKGQE